ncbi:ufm1-specific protease 2 [Lepeophtheirus salmonis]|uniref:ufm1-specific protease 2 n=1 Tax=Lepeophtheirus salmonis TaxID=72036 RepID=UPI001AEABE94|nr:ufm1-specific protease 2-like [Lepeophtheirus salmonis]
MNKVFTTPELINRLNGCSKEACGYLFGVPDLEDGSIIMELSMKPKEDEDDETEEVDAANPFLPTGMDPIGVFILTESDDSLLEEIETLISRLPNDFLSVHDPVVFIRRKKDSAVEAFIDSSLLDPVPISICDDISDKILKVRVRGSLQLICSADEEDITKNFRHLLNKVTCPYGCFRLDNSDVLFLHLWKEGSSKSLQGWSVKSSDFFAKEEEDEEQCLVTNVSEYRTRNVTDLWDFVQAKEDDNDDDDDFIPVGHILKKKKKKPTVVPPGEFMNFKVLLNMSGEAYTLTTYNCSPMVREDTTVKKCFKLCLPIDAIGIMSKKTKIVDAMNILKGCVQRQIHVMGTVVLSEFRSFETVSNPEVFHFKNPQMGSTMVTIVYTKSIPCTNLGHVRKKLHEDFLLPLDRPLFRRCNRYVVDTDSPKSGPLINPHLSIKSPGLGKTYLVQGKYAYHHYMQNGFDDDGWGCAYRSLQTLISWFRLQGYTGTDIPTHAQIQKCLVEIGDKERSFIDSKQWIGSTEVGFVLDTALHVQSKFVSVSSGEEMPMKARDLAHHFETNGTPVMIGGGVLAHTILGIDWNEDTGDVKWLILDPHYTGVDWKDGKPNLSVITGKGWCGWKGPDFWVKNAFYNMCMPIRPIIW